MKSFDELVTDSIIIDKKKRTNDQTYRPRRGRTTGFFGHKRKCGGTVKIKK